MSQSQLAANVAPPKEERPYGGIGCLMLVGFVGALVAGPVFDSDYAIVAVLVATFLGSYFIARKANQFNTEEYPGLYAEWQRRFLCLRCGHSFEEGRSLRFAASPPSLTATPVESSLSVSPPQLPPLQTKFSVRLMSKGDRPISLIKAVHELTGLNISQSKSLIERAPSLIGEYGSFAEANAAKMKLVKTGATAVIEDGQQTD